jgi:c-di-GMP-binding flagellar brake protein YcgR
MIATRQPDLRNSIRFPLHLRVTLKTAAGEYRAETTDISAGGISFALDSPIDVGSHVEFAIEMPSEVSGGRHLVSVMCVGRVVRCTEEISGRSIAVVIDGYHFKRL